MEVISCQHLHAQLLPSSVRSGQNGWNIKPQIWPDYPANWHKHSSVHASDQVPYAAASQQKKPSQQKSPATQGASLLPPLEANLPAHSRRGSQGRPRGGQQQRHLVICSLCLLKVFANGKIKIAGRRAPKSISAFQSHAYLTPRQGAPRAVGGGGGAKPGKFEPDVRMEQRKGFPDTKARGNFVGKWE